MNFWWAKSDLKELLTAEFRWKTHLILDLSQQVTFNLYFLYWKLNPEPLTLFQLILSKVKMDDAHGLNVKLFFKVFAKKTLQKKISIFIAFKNVSRFHLFWVLKVGIVDQEKCTKNQSFSLIKVFIHSWLLNFYKHLWNRPWHANRLENPRQKYQRQ